jgi:DNA-binding MarR family transcriptional regulator
MTEVQSHAHLSAAGYRQLAEFRHRIRQFLHFSEEAARAHGLEPQQHQLLLAIKGLPAGERPTIRALSSRLCLRHHSAVELLNRLAERGAINRRHNEQDRREVLVELTARGEEILAKLSALHLEELQRKGPALLGAIREVLDHSSRGARN